MGIERDSDGSWKWVDGTDASGAPWAPGKPDNSKEGSMCGYISKNGLDDWRCNEGYPAPSLCQYDPSGII